MMFKFLNNNNGAITIFSVFAIVVLIGASALVVDFGFRALTKQRLQAAADQAALAGAQSSNNTTPNEANIKSKAKEYAQKAPGTSTDVVNPKVTVKSSGVLVEIEVKRTVPSFFAQDGGATITASARAVAVPANVLPAKIAAPFAIQKIPNMDWVNDNYTNQYKMKINPTNDHEFKYTNICFKNPTTNEEYWNTLLNNYNRKLTIDDTLYSWSDATGSENGVNQFAARLKADKNSDYTNITVGEKRLMMVPVIEKMPIGQAKYSTANLKIIGFVGFFFEDIKKGEMVTIDGVNYYPNFEVIGRFVKVVLPPSPATSSATSFYGPVSVYLVPPEWTWPTS